MSKESTDVGRRTSGRYNTSNPYKVGTPRWESWKKGYHDAVRTQFQVGHPPEEWALVVLDELASATEKFGPMASDHEGYAVILEEIDELWHEIKHGNNPVDMAAEAVQVAAMAIRFLVDRCSEAAK